MINDDGIEYWRWEELQQFVLEHGLAVAEGVDEQHVPSITGKGRELYLLLGLVQGYEPA